jgi:hypothetical protein
MLSKEPDVRLPEFWELVEVDPADVPDSPDRIAWKNKSRDQRDKEGAATQPNLD